MKKIEKFAPLGIVAAAASCSACFPALAGIGSVLGLGVFAAYERQALIVMQVVIFLSMFFAYLGYRRTKYKLSLILSLVSGSVMLYSWYVHYYEIVFFAGLIGLIVAAFWNLWLEKHNPFCKVKK